MNIRASLCSIQTWNERRLHLFEETQGIVRVHQPKVGDPAILRQEPGSEYPIPHDEVVAVILVGFLNDPRVVPAVQIRGAYNVIENAVTGVHIRVFVEAVNRVEHEMQSQHLCADSQDNEGKDVEKILKR